MNKNHKKKCNPCRIQRQKGNIDDSSAPHGAGRPIEKGYRMFALEYAAHELADLLGVCLRTAQRYQSGERIPPNGFKELVKMASNDRRVPDDWPDWFQFNDDGSFQAGAYPIPWQQLEHFGWLTDQHMVAMKTIADLQRRLSALETQLSAQDMLTLRPSRQTLIDLLTEKGRPVYVLQEKQWHRENGC